MRQGCRLRDKRQQRGGDRVAAGVDIGAGEKRL
jgi:hypothetical protein